MPPVDPESNPPQYRMPLLGLLEDNNRGAFASLLEDSDMTLPVLWSMSGGKIVMKDLAELRNVIITGATQTGKSRLIHQLIQSLLFRNHPDAIKLVLVDLKKIEFGVYRVISNHFLAKLKSSESAVIEDVKTAERTLNSLCIELKDRYELLQDAGCMNILDYNRKFDSGKLSPEKGHRRFCYIVLIIDELADGMLQRKQEFEIPLAKLVYDGGRVGLINIMATNQYNNGDIISTRLLGGIDQRAVFRLNDREDNRRFFDTVKVPDIHLAGEFNYREFGRPVEGKGLLLSTEETERVCDYICDQPGFLTTFPLPWYFDETETEKPVLRDVLFDDAARLIVSSQMGSTSLIQRRMKLGYNRAGLLMDELEKYGIVGPNNSSKAREVMIKSDNELQNFFDNIEQDIPYVSPVNHTSTSRRAETPIISSTQNQMLIRKSEKPGCLLFLIVIGFIVVWCFA